MKWNFLLVTKKLPLISEHHPYIINIHGTLQLTHCLPPIYANSSSKKMGGSILCLFKSFDKNKRFLA